MYKITHASQFITRSIYVASAGAALVGASLHHAFLLLTRAVRRRVRRARARARLDIRRAARARLDGMNDRLRLLRPLSLRLGACWLRRGDAADEEVVEANL